MSRLLPCPTRAARPGRTTRARPAKRCTAPAATATWLALAWLACAGPAQAAALADGKPDDSRRPVLAAPTAGADAATLDLASGRIDTVAADGSSIKLQGRVVPLHPSQLLVLAPGGQRYNNAVALRPGMQVRFALEPLPRSSAAGRSTAAAGAVAGSTAATSGASSAATSATRSPAGPATQAATADLTRRIVLIYIDNTP